MIDFLSFAGPEEVLKPTELVNFFQSAVDWGVASARGYLAFMGAVALITYAFKK